MQYYTQICAIIIVIRREISSSMQCKSVNIRICRKTERKRTRKSEREIVTTLFLIRQLHSRYVSLGLYCLMITDEALYPINHAWRVHWAADSSGLMRPSIIDARFNDESASESIAEQYRGCSAVNTHLIHATAMWYFTMTSDSFSSRKLAASPIFHKHRGPPIYRSQLRQTPRTLHTTRRTVHYRDD